MIQAIYGVLFVFVTLGIALAETPKGYVEVTATGSAETRDSALIDACRLAIGKVHGTRILGVMANRNSDGLKIDAAGHQGSKDTSFSVFGRTTDVADNTSMTFGGLLLRYEVLEEQKDTGPTGRWKIQIKGDVLNTIPDKFAGRLAVVLPSVNRIVSKMKSPDLSPEAIEGLARKLHDSVRDIFANHPQFVLLERENEDILNEELNRAQGSNAAVMEQSKLGGEKVADIVVEILPNPAKVELKTYTFENTPPLQKVKVHVSGLIKLLDLSTKGEIGSTKFDAANPKAVSSAGDVNNAISKAVNELNDTLDESMRSAKRNILTSLGLANLLYTKTGEFAFAGGFDPSLISNGDRITIWKDEAGKKIKIREGEIALISTGFNFQDSPNANNEFKSGDAFTFTVVDSAKNKISEEKTTTNPNKPKLKDKLDFDL
jgi:hypothetical protein